MQVHGLKGAMIILGRVLITYALVALGAVLIALFIFAPGVGLVVIVLYLLGAFAWDDYRKREAYWKKSAGHK
jgi:hypothetical protein